jgi:outer membrane protein assembly factor BamB
LIPVLEIPGGLVRRRRHLPAAVIFAFVLAAGPLHAQKAIRNGADWVDTTGRPISCHDGGITRVGDMFYWYGTNYDGNPKGLWGRPGAKLQRPFNAYSSRDLVDWKLEGPCLEFPKEGRFALGTCHRPNVLHDERGGKFVMWFFLIGEAEPEYPAAMLNVAVAERPAGPFRILGARRTAEEHGWGQDLGLFRDDDGKGYLVYDDGHRNIRIDLLSSDYTESTGKTAIALAAAPGKVHEGAALVRCKGKYIAAGSGVEGWNVTDTWYAVAEAPLGPWKEMGLLSEKRTWQSQISNFVYLRESDAVLAMCDQWFVGPNGLDRSLPIDRSRQLWLPVDFDPATGLAKMRYVESWVPLPVAKGEKPPATGAAWPQLRGPGGSGVSDAEGLPETWSATENVAWKVPVPGRGWSSPIAWGDRVFLTTAASGGTEEVAKKGLYLGGDRSQPSGNRHRWLVLGLDLAAGKTLWEAEAHAGPPGQPRHIKNSHASETPCTDGERVFALFGHIGLFAYDFSGKPLWSKRWESRRMRSGWGTAASPVLLDGKVIVVRDNEEKSWIAAFDARTGDEVWRTERDEKSNWSTPLVWRTPERVEIVTNGTGKVRSYDAGGKLLWEMGGMSSITIPTPVAGHGLAFVSSGFIMDPRRPIVAVRPGAAGDITLDANRDSSAAVAWRRRTSAPYNPSPLLYGDLLYVLLDRGLLGACDARTGNTVYEPRQIDPEARAFTASPWACGGKVFCLSEDGDTFVIAAGPEFKVLGKSPVGEMCLATPAVAGDSLLLRTETCLYRIRRAAK